MDTRPSWFFKMSKRHHQSRLLLPAATRRILICAFCIQSGLFATPPGPDRLESLTKQVQSKNEIQRTEAALKMAAHPSRAVPLLGKLSAHRNWRIRKTAVLALGWTRKKKALPFLQAALKDNDREVVREARAAIRRITNTEDVNVYLDDLKRKEKPIRLKAIEALGELKDKKACRALNFLLKDSDAALRTASVTALGKIGGPDSEKTIIPMLSDRTSQVQWEAIMALARLKSIAAAPRLIEILQGGNVYLSEVASWALLCIQPTRLDTLLPAVQSRHWHVRYFAVKTIDGLNAISLAQLSRTLSPLATDSDALIRDDAIFALARKTGFFSGARPFQRARLPFQFPEISGQPEKLFEDGFIHLNKTRWKRIRADPGIVISSRNGTLHFGGTVQDSEWRYDGVETELLVTEKGIYEIHADVRFVSLYGIFAIHLMNSTYALQLFSPKSSGYAVDVAPADKLISGESWKAWHGNTSSRWHRLRIIRDFNRGLAYFFVNETFQAEVKYHSRPRVFPLRAGARILFTWGRVTFKDGVEIVFRPGETPVNIEVGNFQFRRYRPRARKRSAQ